MQLPDFYAQHLQRYPVFLHKIITHSGNQTIIKPGSCYLKYQYIIKDLALSYNEYKIMQNFFIMHCGILKTFELKDYQNYQINNACLIHRSTNNDDMQIAQIYTVNENINSKSTAIRKITKIIPKTINIIVNDDNQRILYTDIQNFDKNHPRYNKLFDDNFVVKSISDIIAKTHFENMYDQGIIKFSHNMPSKEKITIACEFNIHARFEDHSFVADQQNDGSFLIKEAKITEV